MNCGKVKSYNLGFFSILVISNRTNDENITPLKSCETSSMKENNIPSHRPIRRRIKVCEQVICSVIVAKNLITDMKINYNYNYRSKQKILEFPV